MFRDLLRPGLMLAMLGLWCWVERAVAFDARDLLAQRVGPVLIRPLLEVSERYDDNLFFGLRPTNVVSFDLDRGRFVTNQVFVRGAPVSDFITTVTPGLALALGRAEGNHLAVAYAMEQLFYADNDTQNAANHLIAADVKWQGDRLSFDGTDQIQFLSSIYGGGVGFAGRVDRIMVSDYHRLSYKISEKTGVYLEGSYSAADWESASRLVDYSILQGGPGFLFRAFPKTSFFGELYYGQAAARPNRGLLRLSPASRGLHAEFIGGYLGARGDFTPKVTGTVKAGYENRTYSTGADAIGSPVVEMALTYRLSERTTTSLSYSRRNQPSVQSAGASYLTDDVRLELRQMLGATGKLWAIAGLGVGAYEYEVQQAGAREFTGRSDLVFRPSFRLEYRFQLWLRASLDYNHDRYRSSSPSVVDYDVNRVTLRLAIGYR